MKELNSALFDHLYSRKGEAWLEHGPLKTWYCKVAFKTYFCSRKKDVSNSTIYVHLSGRIPHSMVTYYGGDDGLDFTREDMKALVMPKGRITRMRRIQSNVHTWFCTTELPSNDVNEINAYYVAEGATREEIAEYLARVRHYVLQQSA